MKFDGTAGTMSDVSYADDKKMAYDLQAVAVGVCSDIVTGVPIL
jgi:hypothetical protein